jgi:hypothetical protein
MKKTFALIASLVLLTTITFAQTEFKQYKAGHTFDISLPSYMSKTGGINNAATIQYQSVVKDVYGFVILDTKEELSLVEMNFGSVNEFYEDFIKDFLKDEKKRKISKPIAQTKGNINFIEVDASYYDKDAKTEIFYLVGIVETSKAYYKVLSWSTVENKDKFKADFQQIMYSIKD